MTVATRTRKPAARKSAKAYADKPRFDAYQAVTDSIIERLEAGVVPWHKPWNASTGLPTSLGSGKVYRGINLVWLSLVAQERGYTSRYWMTFNEMVKRGGSLKGERGDASRKGTMVIYFNVIEKVDSQSGEKVRIPLAKASYVYNADQIEGVKLPEDAEVVAHDHDPIEACDAVIADYAAREGLSIRHGGDRAYYHLVEDYVQLPELRFFDSAEEYYGAAFHELGHSTGHSSRLKRPGVSDLPAGHRFGDELYSKEELVAELTSSFLSAHTGIVAATVDNTASYLQNWIDVLKGDKRLIVSAASAAAKAADLILGRNQD